MAKIAIIGTGISGLGAAYLLHPQHDIAVYEKNAQIGGHTRTLTVNYDGNNVPVDTGFIVFNERNYPNFSAMLRHLGVGAHKSDMTFAATIGDGWLEWGAKNANTVFGQRRNMARPAFYRLFRDVMRFNARAEETVRWNPGLTLGQLIAVLGLGDWFRRYYILPMAGAVWSCPPAEMLAFPASSFVRFFANHGLLSASGQPQWYTVTGGAHRYIEKLTAAFAPKIRVSCGAVRVTREGGQVQVTDTTGQTEIYDQVVFACHADEALSSIGDASSKEQRLLGCFRYQKNIAVLHRDERVMPKRKRCWASWVYNADTSAGAEPHITVSYWMNTLQGIDKRLPLFVTLNPARGIAPELVFDTHEFFHPVFDGATMAAQDEIQAMQGARNTWFAGAHLRYGFHEDGLWSAVSVAEKFGITPPWREHRAGSPAREHDRAHIGAPQPVFAGA